MQQDLKEVKMYSDFKSPYAFLAFDPAFALEDKYRVRLKWKPFQLRLKARASAASIPKIFKGPRIINPPRMFAQRRASM
jgi:2-hydroxychromene-2-carboxylate isomerase